MWVQRVACLVLPQWVIQKVPMWKKNLDLHVIYLQEAMSGCIGSAACKCTQYVQIANTSDCYTCGHFAKDHRNLGRISVEGEVLNKFRQFWYLFRGKKATFLIRISLSFLAVPHQPSQSRVSEPEEQKALRKPSACFYLQDFQEVSITLVLLQLHFTYRSVREMLYLAQQAYTRSGFGSENTREKIAWTELQRRGKEHLSSPILFALLASLPYPVYPCHKCCLRELPPRLIAMTLAR